MGKIKIAPSIMDCDLARMGEEVAMVEDAGADILHMDIMDGHYVPSFVGGPRMLKAMKRVATVPIDAHLMVSNPDDAVKWFVDAGADMVSFHPEVANDPAGIIDYIHDAGRLAGIALKPYESASVVEDYAAMVDYVLAMTVVPGFSGQDFMEEGCYKIPELRHLCGDDVDIEVDGGINVGTLPIALSYGANIFVAGSTVFHGEDTPKNMIKSLRNAGQEAILKGQKEA
jgi:ribulose-phosphate 3-epimerase